MKKRIKDLNLSLSEKEDFLYSYCSMNLPDNLKGFLEVYEEKLDVTFDEGGLFSMAGAHEHLEVLSILIDYYKKTQLDELDEKSFEYKYAKRKLQNIVEDMLDSYTASDKVIDIVKDYIPKEEEEESSDTDDDLDDYLEYLSLDPHHIPDEKDAEDSTSLVGEVNG